MNFKKKLLMNLLNKKENTINPNVFSKNINNPNEINKENNLKEKLKGK